MIQANELRIGNYVMDQVSKEFMIVDELGDKVGAVLINRGKYPLPNGWQMTSIPLTPEILKKCGFEIEFSLGRNNALKIIHGIRILVCFYKNGRVDIIIDGDKSRSNFNKKVNSKDVYLHQLQNLYFALTGKELTINL